MSQRIFSEIDMIKTNIFVVVFQNAYRAHGFFIRLVKHNSRTATDDVNFYLACFRKVKWRLGLSFRSPAVGRAHFAHPGSISPPIRRSGQNGDRRNSSENRLDCSGRNGLGGEDPMRS